MPSAFYWPLLVPCAPAGLRRQLTNSLGNSNPICAENCSEINLSLYPTIVRAGAELVCKSCGHKHQASAEWLNTICTKAFPQRVHPVLYEEDLRRLKCSKCSAKDVKVNEPSATAPSKQDTAIGCNVWGDIPFYPDWRDQG